MRVKKGSKIRIIDSLPKSTQDLLDLSEYIGQEFTVLDHWQCKTNALENGEIQIYLPVKGVIILNKGEYEVV